MVSRLVVGYARTSLFGDDAEQQRGALLALGAAPDRVYLDAGLVGMTRPRPALSETLAALRSGDTLVLTALFRLARSTQDAVDLLGRLIDGQVQLVGDVRYPMDGRRCDCSSRGSRSPTPRGPPGAASRRRKDFGAHGPPDSSRADLPR